MTNQNSKQTTQKTDYCMQCLVTDSVM